MQQIDSKTGLTHREAREFIRNHFEEFVNGKNVQIGLVNFAADFVDHGADVPPGMPPGPAGAIQYLGEALKHFPDLRVRIEDMVAEDDKSGGAEPLDCSGSTKREETGVQRDCDLANRQPEDCGALGLP